MNSCEKRQFELCPKFEKTFDMLGKKWNGLIIDVLLEDGTQRFVELANKIPDVSDRVLVERLKELEEKGIITRDEHPIEKKRIDYSLTEKGEALRSVMNEVQSWGEKWM
ncbi:MULTISPECIES: helix-turn-helix domain-containing protein [Enterococcaceae]|uniref:winged helix-turn-helix transcriptional regulator n=1 Tax=Enterococcaceae TaxID=81852 RepID=UPI000E47193B|nr:MULTISPECIES: helix-turn-helix domain-containing protein [Enterococcaceae]MCI0129948.1 helix-turn-helix transcriptional regulator [Vagococcus sp. CY53-2]RGI30819.1 transcriptional regulator [Melissococcus sp. OM08-11BH]UNM88796.1 helix-turn-helix transcriptional regulator [Vagococcus sp. CY52-2]